MRSWKKGRSVHLLWGLAIVLLANGTANSKDVNVTVGGSVDKPLGVGFGILEGIQPLRLILQAAGSSEITKAEVFLPESVIWFPTDDERPDPWVFETAAIQPDEAFGVQIRGSVTGDGGGGGGPWVIAVSDIDIDVIEPEGPTETADEVIDDDFEAAAFGESPQTPAGLCLFQERRRIRITGNAKSPGQVCFGVLPGGLFGQDPTPFIRVLAADGVTEINFPHFENVSAPGKYTYTYFLERKSDEAFNGFSLIGKFIPTRRAQGTAVPADIISVTPVNLEYTPTQGPLLTRIEITSNPPIPDLFDHTTTFKFKGRITPTGYDPSDEFEVTHDSSKLDVFGDGLAISVGDVRPPMSVFLSNPGMLLQVPGKIEGSVTLTTRNQLECEMQVSFEITPSTEFGEMIEGEFVVRDFVEIFAASSEDNIADVLARENPTYYGQITVPVDVVSEGSSNRPDKISASLKSFSPDNQLNNVIFQHIKTESNLHIYRTDKPILVLSGNASLQGAYDTVYILSSEEGSRVRIDDVSKLSSGD